MRPYSLYLLIIASSLLVTGCGHKMMQKKVFIARHINKQAAPCSDRKCPPITIWIHGTRFFTNALLPNFFYCPQGLTVATDLDSKYHHRVIAETLATCDPLRFPLETFYLFGWSGTLSFSARKQAAVELCNALAQLVREYEATYAQKPVIRIITHSHAGNVVLNMATVKLPHHDFSINELIMLACPVQIRTAALINDPLFEKVYSIFSTMDSIQILDPQGLYRHDDGIMDKRPLFSGRTFKPCPHVAQIKLKINGHGVMHMGFLFNKFLTLLPAILDEIDNWYHKQPTTQPKLPWLLSIIEKRMPR